MSGFPAVKFQVTFRLSAETLTDFTSMTVKRSFRPSWSNSGSHSSCDIHTDIARHQIHLAPLQPRDRLREGKFKPIGKARTVFTENGVVP